MQIIRSSAYTRMRWKNGMGETAEIDREPAGDQAYLWRLSQACVRNDCPFSEYPGYDRWLVVWQGEGLRLNGRPLPPLTPLRFRGEDKIDCECIGGEVADVGLIFDRALVEATMTVVSGPLTFPAPGVHYLFDLASGDTLKLTFPAEMIVPPSILITARRRALAQATS